MKDEICHTKVPGPIYKALQRKAKEDHRTLHSLCRHILIQYAEGKLTEKEKQ